MERIGNKLPDPFWLFVIIGGIVLVSSWAGSKLGLTATDPNKGETIHITNLLSGEGLSRIVSEAVTNYTSFPPLGLIIVVMLGVAVAEHSGLISAAIRSVVSRVGPKTLTFVVALAGVTGSIASDAVFVILVPLGAMAFRAVGRSPIVGAMVAFAASSAGFNASLVLNITDVLLAGISSSAAQIVDPKYVVSPLANYFFVIGSSFVLALIVTAVAELYINKKARELVDHDEVDYDAVDFGGDAFGGGSDPIEDATNTSAAAGGAGAEKSAPAGAAEGARGEDAAGDHHANTTAEVEGARGEGGVDNGENAEDDGPNLTITPREKRALKLTGLAAIVMTAIYFALLFVGGSPLQGPGGNVLKSPLIQDVGVPIAASFFLLGVIYGLLSGSIREWGDIPDFMIRGIRTLLPMMVLFFAVSQFLAWFTWSNLGSWTAINGAKLLQQAHLPPLLMFALFVLMVALINLFITSGSAQWALMAPVVVPMFMYVNVSPEVTQMLFRMGDSPSNIITPMSPYFALALTFLQRYYKRAGIGTLMSLTLPFAVAMLVGWFLFFAVWYLLGLPLGPGTPMTYPAG
ncbi:AbgT family transporter [Corynebacterium heidelbergense]|uniref:AbgT family transporter n=1 Tax=Corynebacterium heidelbergense TaxID=2055947 RepID=UPI001EE6A794|nr:AbgT family transporter [Corynebacterium heidelbergense]